MAREPITQDKQRRSINPLDQFGRKWLTYIEIATGDSTGGFFSAGWQDPLATPAKYLKVPRTPEGQPMFGRIEVDFPRWIQDHEIAEREWYEQLHQNALTMYKKLEAGDVAKLEHDRFLLDLTGPKPKPSTEVLRKAAQGYKPFLGLAPLSADDRVALKMATLADVKAGTDMQPALAEPAADVSIVPDTYKEFLAWAFKTKAAASLKEAAELWRQHREALNAA